MSNTEIEPFSYDGNTAPPGYHCAKCGGGNRKLWRVGASSHIDLACFECGSDDPAERLKLIESDQFAGRVPAIPDEDGGSWWGYTSVPQDGVEWWYRLPCVGRVRPGHVAMSASDARAARAAFEAERQARRDEMNAEQDRNRLATRYVVEATDYEMHCLWERWHYRVDSEWKRKPLAWEQVSMGLSQRIGMLADMPVCVSVFWARVEGALVAFYDATSQVVDHRMVEKWMHENFPAATSWSNAQNFHNTVLAIEHDKTAKRR